MQDFRGVMADAECPRCNTTAPPPEGKLATCKRCGLVFTPHEIRHRGRRSNVVEEVEPKPLPPPPPRVTARREGKAIVISWPVTRYVAVFLFSLAMALAWVAVNQLVSFYNLFWYGAALTCVPAILQLLADHVITLEGDHVTHHVAFRFDGRRWIELDRVGGIEVKKNRWAMWELHLTGRAPSLLARSTDQKPLAYAAAIIAEYLET